MNIGDNIKLKREELGISRAALVDSSGVSIAQLSRIERGEQNNPNLETLVAITTALQCTLDELVFGEESSNSIYLNSAIDKMPKEKQKFLRDMIKMTMLVSKQEEMVAEEKMLYKKN